MPIRTARMMKRITKVSMRPARDMLPSFFNYRRHSVDIKGNESAGTPKDVRRGRHPFADFLTPLKEPVLI